MSLFTDAREELVDVYRTAGLPAYGFTPPVLVPPIVVVEPAGTWITPNRVSPQIRAALQLRVVAYVTLIDSAQAISQLEQLVESIITATPTGVLITSVDAPQIDGTSAQGDTLTAAVNITAQVTEEN